MTFVGRDIDLELALAAWRHYDYTYPRQFPEVLYVTDGGTSTECLTSSAVRYVRSEGSRRQETEHVLRQVFLLYTRLSKEEYQGVPCYVRAAPKAPLDVIPECKCHRMGILILGGAYAVLVLFALVSLT